jgi:predicted transcriptional regulator
MKSGHNLGLILGSKVAAIPANPSQCLAQIKSGIVLTLREIDTETGIRLADISLVLRPLRLTQSTKMNVSLCKHLLVQNLHYESSTASC